MKTTMSSTYRTMLHNLNLNSSRLQAAQIASVTGKKMVKASDNPGGVGPVLSVRAQIKAADLYLKSGETTQDRLKAQDTGLGQADNLLARAIELTVAAGDGIYSAAERAGMANEIRDLKEEMFGVANGQMGGKYFYGGYQDQTPPFVVNPAYDPVLDPRPVLYNGDNGVVQQEIAPDEKLAVNFKGNEVFLGDGNGDGLVDGGQVDIFAVLSSLEEALAANDQAGATAQLDNLYQAQEQIGVFRAKTGAVANRLDRALNELQDVQLDLQGILSRYEDVDLAEAISEMTQQEQALEVAMSVTGRISKLSILDYF